MKSFFITLFHRWRSLLHERTFRISFLAGIALLLAAYVINYEASVYTASVPVLSVGDAILDNLPTINLSAIYIFGIVLTEIIFFVYPIFFKPELAPFTAKTAALFYIVRSFFIILTHLGAPANFFNLPQFAEQTYLGRFFFLNDLFFSGHTGFPYLGALLFWQNKPLRIFLLLMSFAQAATVLLMHVHYSIDVFSAYFITHSIYVVSNKVFNELNLSFKRIAQRVDKYFQ